RRERGRMRRGDRRVRADRARRRARGGRPDRSGPALGARGAPAAVPRDRRDPRYRRDDRDRAARSRHACTARRPRGRDRRRGRATRRAAAHRRHLRQRAALPAEPRPLGRAARRRDGCALRRLRSGDRVTAALEASSSVELAIAERSGWPESRHLGAAVLVDAEGRVVRALGDPTALIYPRSTLKLVQAAAVELLGVVFDAEETVLSAASHSGTPAHVAVVERMLARAGLDASALRCPADWPSDPAARRTASGPQRITMNCSGKHAGFLAAAAARGWPLESYL